MKERTKENLKAIGELTLEFLAIGVLTCGLIKGVSCFDRWQDKHIEEREKEEYQKRKIEYPTQKPATPDYSEVERKK